MTFDLVLSSLYYHGREWFVFQDILAHLSQEKAAAATQRSKTTPKYTYRFGITRDWVTGESKKILVERHFIDSSDSGRSLIFSSVLIDAGRVEELFHESFTKKFRLKVQQFHLTANSLDACWFEWHFDPKQKEGRLVKKTKLTVDENDRRSSVGSKGPDKTPQNDHSRHSDSENLTPNMSSESTESPQSLKRRRSALENGSSVGNQSASEFLPTISEAVLMRPRKKAREANLSISKYLNENEQQDDDVPATKEEPMSPDFKPDLSNLPDIKIKRSLSPLEKPKVKMSPNSSPQRIVKNDVMLSSVSARDSNSGSDTDCDQGTIDVPRENNANPQNSENLNPSDELSVQNNDSVRETDIHSSNDVSQVSMALDNEDTTKSNNENIENSGNNNALVGINIPNNNPVDSSTEDCSSSDDSHAPDSNVPDDDNIVPQIVPQTPSSPTSSLLDNSKDIMENIKLREQELCNDEVVVGDKTPEVPSTSVDMNCQAATHKHDCGAEACTGNGASSTVCLCADQEASKKEKPAESVRSTEASELLDGLIAAGFIDQVRQLFENVKDDTRLFKMEAELNTLRNQINQKRKANHQLQKSIKKKAGELEKLFDNLRKGKAHCEMLEQKHKALQVEKSTVEAKVKKCLEVLNAVD